MEMQKVESSALAEVGYENGEIGVRYKNGALHYYPGTKPEFEDMLAAESIGKHFLTVIKPRGGRKINETPDDRGAPPPMEEPLARA